MAGQLPKAYLRIDPNLDQTHPDPGLFVRLLCAASRQPARGRFKDRAVLERCLGKRGAASVLGRRDVVDEAGVLVVDGWDIWQEGDLSVADRMRRYRNKSRNGSVTDRDEGVTPHVAPLSPPDPPISPEASGGRQKASTDLPAAPGETPSALAVVEPKPQPWNSRACEELNRRYGGTAPGARITKALRPLVGKHGEDSVLAAWATYLDETAAEYVSPERFAATFGRWSGKAPPPKPKGGTLAAAAAFIARGRGGQG